MPREPYENTILELLDKVTVIIDARDLDYTIELERTSSGTKARLYVQSDPHRWAIFEDGEELKISLIKLPGYQVLDIEAPDLYEQFENWLDGNENG